MGKILLSRCDKELIDAKDQAAVYLSGIGCDVEDLVLPELLYFKYFLFLFLILVILLKCGVQY